MATIKLPGRVYETLNERAQVSTAFERDLDVCASLASPRIYRRGGGFTIYLTLNPGQIRRLARWITDDDNKRLRDYREALLTAAKTAAEREES